MNEDVMPDEMDELNRQIAEKLGWTDLEWSGYWEESPYDVAYRGCWQGTSPDGKENEWVPRFAHDLDLVIDLLPIDEWSEWIIQPKRYPNQVSIAKKRSSVAYLHEGRSYSHAAALAWWRTYGDS